jgi:hypothetical protein
MKDHVWKDQVHLYPAAAAGDDQSLDAMAEGPHGAPLPAEFSALKKQVLGTTLWARGYFGCSPGCFEGIWPCFRYLPVALGDCGDQWQKLYGNAPFSVIQGVLCIESDCLFAMSAETYYFLIASGATHRRSAIGVRSFSASILPQTSEMNAKSCSVQGLVFD